MNTFVTSNLGELFYYQEGSGPPLVYIHGNLGSHRDFTLSPLHPLTTSYQVTAFDRYGAGNSRRKEKRSVSLEEHADSMAEAISALGLRNPIIMGHSYGGAVALMLALRHPNHVSSLVLLAPAAHDWEGEGVSEYRLLTTPFIGALIMETLFVPLASLSIKKAFQAVFAPAKVPQAYLNEAARVATVPDHFIASAMDMQIVRTGLQQIGARYEEITVPTVVLAGGQDTITPFWNHGKRLQENLPRARVLFLDDAGHQIHFSNAEEVFAALEILNEL